MRKKTKVAHELNKKSKYAALKSIRPNINNVVRVFYDANGVVLDFGHTIATPMHYRSIFELTTDEMHQLMGQSIKKNDEDSILAILQCAIASGRRKFCKRYEKYWPKALASLYASKE